MDSKKKPTLDERIAKINKMDFAFNDAVYDLVRDVVVNDVVREMDMRFRTIHSVSTRGGGGQNGSDTTAIVITKPRDFKHGFWNRMKHLCNPNKTVISIRLRGMGVWSCNFDQEYEQYATKMEHVYYTQLAFRLF